MSRLNQRELRDTPCKQFNEWGNEKTEIKMPDGDVVEKLSGSFTTYDKDAKEKVKIPLPFKFAILEDNLVNFKGYDKNLKMGRYSNEVRQLPKEVEVEMEVPTLGKKLVKVVDCPHNVTIRDKNGILTEFNLGDYKTPEVQGKLSQTKAKYGRSVYIGVPDAKGKIELQNLQIGGAAMTGAVAKGSKNPDELLDGWFNFTNVYKRDNALYKHWIVVKKFKAKKSEATKFTIPVFEIGERLTKEEERELDKLAGEVDDWLDYYFKKGQSGAKRYYLVGSNKEVTDLVEGKSEEKPAEAVKPEIKKVEVKTEIQKETPEDELEYSEVDDDDESGY